MGLRIYDTKTRDKIDFEPLEPGKVGMYLCGITPYAPSHVGHARSALAFDVVFRWLRRKYQVTYVRNFTDVDDKLIRTSQAEGAPLDTIAQRYIDLYQADLRRLNCLDPTFEPRVTTHMVEVVDTVKCLQERGFAYEVEGDVYYDVTKFAGYGQLSGRTLGELEAGARVEVDERKHTPFDFALWKSAKPGEPSWDSPWGQGRPGWHIECSAMANKYLGKTFDIHGGGKDLVFPHHENELAQSCAAYDTAVYSNVWMHNGFVNLMPEACPKCNAELREAVSVCSACGHTFSEDELKMSKSRGNFYPIHEMLGVYEGEALRLLFLGSHYRKPIAFSHALLEEAEKKLDKFYETLRAIDEFVGQQTFTPGKNFAASFGFDPRAEIAETMDDDFNTVPAIATMDKVFRIANDLTHAQLSKRPPADTSRLLTEVREIVREAGEVLGLWLDDPKAYLERRKSEKSKDLSMTPAEIEAAIEARTQARKQRDFKRADEIRKELESKGIVLMDSKEGTTWSVEE